MASLLKEPILTMNEMAAVLKELPYSTKWKAIGRNFGIAEERLEEIEVNKRNTDEYLDEVIKLWLRRLHKEEDHGPPTWSNLAKAVESIDNALAIRIRKNHGLEEQEKVASPTQQSFPDVSVNFLRAKCKALQKLSNELRCTINSDFAGLKFILCANDLISLDTRTTGKAEEMVSEVQNKLQADEEVWETLLAVLKDTNNYAMYKKFEQQLREEIEEAARK